MNYKDGLVAFARDFLEEDVSSYQFNILREIINKSETHKLVMGRCGFVWIPKKNELLEVENGKS